MPKFIGWIPTEPEYVDYFLKLVPLSAKDTVFDLGSGDGRLLFAALEKGAGRCVGIDIDPERINAARKEAEQRGLGSKVAFVEADVPDVDLSEASVILCYLFPSASAALRPKFEKELKQGTKVVMESFAIPGWKPDKTEQVNYKSFYLYTMLPGKTADYDSAIVSQPHGGHHDVDGDEFYG